MNWIFFPKHKQAPEHLLKVTEVFQKSFWRIDSCKNDTNKKRLKSDQVLKIIENRLKKLGYSVEKSKKKEEKIRRPVLYGTNGSEELAFEADAYSAKLKTVVEVEAGRALTNYQFLKDAFQASMMIETDYLVLAVRRCYRGRNDFDEIKKFIETIYLTNRIQLDLKGILLVGY